MSITQEKLTLSMQEAIANCLYKIKEDIDKLSVLNFTHNMFLKINKLSVENKFIYTYDFSNSTLEILEYIKNCSGDVNDDDISIVHICINALEFILNSEAIESIDSLKYEYVCKKCILDLQKYSIKSLNLNNLIKKDLEHFKENNTSSLLKALDGYKLKIKESLSINADIIYNNISIQSKELDVINVVFDILLTYMKKYIKQDGNESIKIKSYITNANLYVVIDVSSLKIYFEHITSEIVKFGFLSENEISNMNNAQIFDSLINAKYLDKSGLFFDFKKIKMQLDLHLGNFTYKETNDIKTFTISMPCDFSINSSIVHIGSEKYLLPSMYIDEISSIEDINAINNVNLLINDVFLPQTTQSKYIVAIKHDDKEISFYCDNIYKYDNVLIKAISQNIDNILGVYRNTNENILMLDALKILKQNNGQNNGQ